MPRLRQVPLAEVRDDIVRNSYRHLFADRAQGRDVGADISAAGGER